MRTMSITENVLEVEQPNFSAPQLRLGLDFTVKLL